VADFIGERVDSPRGYVMSFYIAVWNSGTAISSRYSEVEMVPEDELDACPWASGLEVAGDHVIMAIPLEQAQKIIGQIVALAAQLELVCFDPQAGKVYPAAHLRKKPAASATGSARASELQPAPMQVNDDFKAGGGDDPACFRAEK